jgi:hypothetical protein
MSEDNLGSEGKFINEGGDLDGVDVGDGSVQIADFTDEPPEVIEGRTGEQQAADAQQAQQEGSISAMTPEEGLASGQKAEADREAAFDAFRDGYVPGPDPTNGMDTIYYQQWQELVREGKEFARIVDEADPPEPR